MNMETSMQQKAGYVSTLRELVDACANKHAGRPAFLNCESAGDGEVSFREVKEEVLALGSALAGYGERAHHTAILGENSYLWILSYMAIVYGGNVAVPLNWNMAAEELAQMLRISDSTLLIYSDTYEDVASELKKSIPDIELLPMRGIPDLLEEEKKRGISSPAAERGISGKDLASIVFTSGTTNHPKGVMLTHGNICACIRGNCDSVWITGTSLLVLPLHHTLGLVVSMLSVFYSGYASYICRSLKNIKRDFLKCRPENTIVVPMIVEALQKMITTAMQQAAGGDERAAAEAQAARDALSNLHLIVSGGAPLAEEHIRFFEKIGVVVLNGYGTTECAPVIATNRNDRVIPESVGFPITGMEVRISKDGEVQVRGESVMPGYYNNEEETDAAFTEDGWYRTGDLGSLDESGALHITGRLKNLIILSNGENLLPGVLEREVEKIPYVLEVIVFQEGETIAAEVFLDPNAPDARGKIDEDIRIMNSSLPVNRNIGKIIVRDRPFPRTALQKIHRDYA